jgi:hypothetical protein
MTPEPSNPDNADPGSRELVVAPALPGTVLESVGPPASPDQDKVPNRQAPAVQRKLAPPLNPLVRQLAELPRDELSHLAEALGLDPARLKTHTVLANAIHDRRQLIASMDRPAMLDVVRWGRRPVTINASKEQIAQEIARIDTMNFAGLSPRGVVILAQLRGLSISSSDSLPVLIRRLQKQEGLFARLNRRRRSMLGHMVASIVGENPGPADYRYLPDAAPQTKTDPRIADDAASEAPPTGTASPTSIREEIEEAGLFGGISNRIKKTADLYLNQKLDEIEARIDRKLDEIDRRLAQWRDKEIANRIRILKITLWASVIVGVFSLIYAYVTQYFVHTR